jgi:hypothetical protein
MGKGSVLPENARRASGPRIVQQGMQNPLDLVQYLFTPHFEDLVLDREAAGDGLTRTGCRRSIVLQWSDSHVNFRKPIGSSSMLAC